MLNSIQHLLPPQAKAHLNWETSRPVLFKLKENRTSKWGYFKPGMEGNPHVVSLNSDLNPYAFLFTLVHEMSHVLCWEKYGSSVKPHGPEWKSVFKRDLFRLLQQDVFPAQLVKPIWKSIVKPKASCQAHPELMKAFSIFDANNPWIFLDSLETQSSFEIQNGRRFTIEKKLRKRYRCREIDTGRWYVFSPIARVRPV